MLTTRMFSEMAAIPGRRRQMSRTISSTFTPAWEALYRAAVMSAFSSALVFKRIRSDERQGLFDEDMDGVRYVWRDKERGAQVFIGREQYLAVDLVGKHSEKKPDVFYARYYWAPNSKGQASVYTAYIDERGFGDDDLEYWAEGFWAQTRPFAKQDCTTTAPALAE